MKEKFTRICPKCGSTDISVDFSNPAVWDYGAPPNYKCNICDNIGKFFPEVKEELSKYFSEKVIKTQLKTEKVNMDFARAYAKVPLKIFSPLYLIFSIWLLIEESYWAGFISLLFSLLFFYAAFKKK